MRFLLGSPYPDGSDQPHVFLVEGDQAIDLTQIELWTVASTIATISKYATLATGDMIAMGAPLGVGHAKTPLRWLRPGEDIEVEIEGIGVCANPIVAEESLSLKVYN